MKRIVLAALAALLVAPAPVAAADPATLRVTGVTNVYVSDEGGCHIQVELGLAVDGIPAGTSFSPAADLVSSTVVSAVSTSAGSIDFTGTASGFAQAPWWRLEVVGQVPADGDYVLTVAGGETGIAWTGHVFRTTDVLTAHLPTSVDVPVAISGCPAAAPAPNEPAPSASTSSPAPSPTPAPDSAPEATAVLPPAVPASLVRTPRLDHMVAF